MKNERIHESFVLVAKLEPSDLSNMTVAFQFIKSLSKCRSINVFSFWYYFAT